MLQGRDGSATPIGAHTEGQSGSGTVPVLSCPDAQGRIALKRWRSIIPVMPITAAERQVL
jgi:hypothetical protein